jgi:hypothetical protein
VRRSCWSCWGGLRGPEQLWEDVDAGDLTAAQQAQCLHLVTDGGSMQAAGAGSRACGYVALLAWGLSWACFCWRGSG